MNNSKVVNDMKVLIIGPSITKSKGGMATMIKGLMDSEFLSNNNLSFYASYIDGSFFIRLIYSIFAYIRFIFLRKEYDIYHIHSASYGSFFRKTRYLNFLKRKKKKVIFHIHGAEFLIFYQKLSNHKKSKVINALKNADVVVALSEGWKNSFENVFGIKNCVAIPNAIKVDEFKMCQCNIVENRENFISLGRLGERKGTYLLINAVKNIIHECPNIKVYLAGDGEINKVSEIVRNNGLEKNIIILGWIDINEKKKYLSKASTLILPSYNEGLPMSILEAMAAKKIILSTDVGAIPNVVSEKNGFLIKPGDIDSLSNAMKKIYNNLCDCQQKAENSLSIVKNEYDEKVIHIKIDDLYNKMGK